MENHRRKRLTSKIGVPLDSSGQRSGVMVMDCIVPNSSEMLKLCETNPCPCPDAMHGNDQTSPPPNISGECRWGQGTAILLQLWLQSRFQSTHPSAPVDTPAYVDCQGRCHCGGIFQSKSHFAKGFYTESDKRRLSLQEPKRKKQKQKTYI